MASLSKKDLEYRHESNAVSLINMHFVFIPKRRKAVLVGKIAERLQEIIFEVVTGEQMEDYCFGDYARSRTFIG